MVDKEGHIKRSLSRFLSKHNVDCEDVIDDIVLSYLVSILQDLGTDDGAQEHFDVDEFIEMMDAYLPGFANIENVQVCDWMFKLATDLQNKSPSNAGEENGEVESMLSLSHAIESTPVAVPSTGRQRKNSRKSSGSQSSEESHSLRRESQTSSDLVANGSSEDEQVRMLREMFPGACSMEIRHCLCVAHGVVDKAAQLMLHRQDTGECISNKLVASQAGRKPEVVMDDHQMKESILNKYSYVDTEDDSREHRPMVTQKQKDTKKLVRYLDSKVVTTKGERFTEIKKEGEVDPKKFQINLKPAKQYRFH